MSERIRAWIHQHYVGLIAIFIALSGTAYAVDGPLAGQDTVGSADIINGEVKQNDLGGSSVGSGKIADESVKNIDLGPGASSSNTIADGGVKGIDIGNSEVQGTDVLDDNLTGADIDESSLLGVDAGTLGGMDSSKFVQGEARLFLGTPFGSSVGTVVEVPDVGKVRYTCAVGFGGDADLFFDYMNAHRRLIDETVLEQRASTGRLTEFDELAAGAATTATDPVDADVVTYHVAFSGGGSWSAIFTAWGQVVPVTQGTETCTIRGMAIVSPPPY